VVTFHPEVGPPEGVERNERVATMTQQCADAIAGGIAADPQDWHMLQRVFVADLLAGTPAAAGSA
jgi:KDO2-lipid IV(A) lauroyltransferase